MVTPGSGGGSRKRTARHLAEALPQPTRPARRHGRSRRATGASVGAAARRPARATARATRTPIASAAIPGRSSGNGPESGAVRRCAPASALRGCAVLLRLVAHPRTPARRRSAQTTTGRRLARAVHRDRSVRELGGGRRRRLRRRLNAWASIAVCEQDRSSASAYSTAPAASSRSPASVVAADLKEREY